MHFCLTGQYTPQALNSIMDNPTVSRYEAAKNLIEAAGGKLISMYSTATDGPGVLVIETMSWFFDLSQVFDGPLRYGESSRFETMPSRS